MKRKCKNNIPSIDEIKAIINKNYDSNGKRIKHDNIDVIIIDHINLIKNNE